MDARKNSLDDLYRTFGNWTFWNVIHRNTNDIK